MNDFTSDGFNGLRFPCDCVTSRRGGYSDPWAGIAKHKLLPNGTKEEILNLVAQEPKTISQIADALGLSARISMHTAPPDLNMEASDVNPHWSFRAHHDVS
jgi:hypothetical protein